MLNKVDGWIWMNGALSVGKMHIVIFLLIRCTMAVVFLR